MSNRRVAYYYDNDVGMFSYGYGHAMKPQRIRMTHDLVASYGMLDRMQVLRPRRASPLTMTRFHTDEYIHFLSRVTPETAEELTYHGTQFLVGDDNPPFDGVFEFCSISAGGSIDGARRITSGAVDIAINWAGGLHHAKKREASGFCYVNDIVLGILELLRTFPRVLYIDIDCHHGDGVEEAFYTTDRVLTCSFHKFGEYFPGTGHVEDHGRGKGLGYAVNVPLRDGLTDEAFKSVFEPVIQRILDWYQPSAVVLQCGADSLAGDKLGCFNLTMEGHASCTQYLRKSGLPLILLGGGGYTIKNVCRTWAYETACALNIEDSIDRNLPWNAYFEWFGPRYQLEVLANNMSDMNPKDGHLDSIKEKIFKQMSGLPFAPSVQMHEVPGESLGEHLGLPDMAVEERRESEELDIKLGEQYRRVFGMTRSDSSSSSDDEEPGSIYDENESDASDRRGRLQHRHLYPHQYTKRMSILSSSNNHNPKLDYTFDYEHDQTSYSDSYSHSNPNARIKMRTKTQARIAPRRFFHSSAVWDPILKTVVPREGVFRGATDARDPFDVERKSRSMGLGFGFDDGAGGEQEGRVFGIGEGMNNGVDVGVVMGMGLSEEKGEENGDVEVDSAPLSIE